MKKISANIQVSSRKVAMWTSLDTSRSKKRNQQKAAAAVRYSENQMAGYPNFEQIKIATKIDKINIRK